MELGVGDRVRVTRVPFPQPDLMTGRVVAVLRNGALVVTMDKPVFWTDPETKKKRTGQTFETTADNLRLAAKFGEVAV